MADKKLILMVGLPRSGKSTQCKTLSANYAETMREAVPIVNIDSVRLAVHGQPYLQEAEPYVWVIAHTLVKTLFHDHNIVILDACNNTRKRRDEWKSKSWEREFVVLDTDAEECSRRAITDGMDKLVPIIERMQSQHEPVADDE